MYSWAAWSLPYLTRKLLSAQLPTAQPSRTPIQFWFSFPLLWGQERERERFSLIQNQASVLCCLLLPYGTFKVLQELLKRERGSWMLSFRGEGKPSFFGVDETHLTSCNSPLSPSVFLPIWKSPKNAIITFICFTNLSECDVKYHFGPKIPEKPKIDFF